MSMAWTPSAIPSYCSAHRQFLNFCKQFGQVNQDKSILPASEITILRFIAYTGRRLSASSVRNYLSAVRNLHLVFGFPDPLKGLPRVPPVIKGLKRFQGDKKRVKTPITALVLMSMKYQLNFNNYGHIMVWAACCLAFLGFLRCSEFTVPSSVFILDTHLTQSDVLTDKIPFPDSLMINIKKSKTDQFKRGFTIVLGKTNSQICPVAAILTHLHLRGQKNGPIFIFKDGSPLTRDKFSRLVN